jgi:hypothetical protein
MVETIYGTPLARHTGSPHLGTVDQSRDSCLGRNRPVAFFHRLRRIAVMGESIVIGLRLTPTDTQVIGTPQPSMATDSNPVSASMADRSITSQPTAPSTCRSGMVVIERGQVPFAASLCRVGATSPRGTQPKRTPFQGLLWRTRSC